MFGTCRPFFFSFFFWVVVFNKHINYEHKKWFGIFWNFFGYICNNKLGSTGITTAGNN